MSIGSFLHSTSGGLINPLQGLKNIENYLSPDNSAQKEAEAQQQAQQAEIDATQQRINDIFNDPQRQADIQKFVDATRQYYTDQLNKQHDTAARNLKFALARSGLTGGSTQVDQNTLLGQDYQQGLLKAEQAAQGAGASLKSSDEDARQKLLTLATSGLGLTDAASQASQSLANDLDANRATATADNLGDMFADVNAFKTSAYDAYNQRKVTDTLKRQGLYAPGPSYNYGGP